MTKYKKLKRETLPDGRKRITDPNTGKSWIVDPKSREMPAPVRL